jgi:hypothetical protein
MNLILKRSQELLMQKGEGRRRSWGGMQLNIKEESDEFILLTKEVYSFFHIILCILVV